MKGELKKELGLTSEQARVILGVARSVVEADDVGPRSRVLLDLLAEALDLSGWQTIAVPSDVAVRGAFERSSERRALVDALVIPAAIECEVTHAREAAVRRWARALEVESHWVEVLGPMRRRSVWGVRRQLFPRSPDGRRVLSRAWEEERWIGLWRALLFTLGLFRDPPLAARFRALGALAEGTLGRTFHDHLVSRGMTFPGEAGGLPERMIHHDLMHVLDGDDTDPAGECELGGFYAACASGDSFTFIVTILATFQLGLPVSPAIVTPAIGAFDPRRVLAAWLRGRRVNVDVLGRWDYWSLMPLTLDEARAHLGIARPVASHRIALSA